MSEDLLFDASFILGMKVFDDEYAFADFVKLFYAPPFVVHINKILYVAVSVLIDKGCPQAKSIVTQLIFDEANFQRYDEEFGMLTHDFVPRCGRWINSGNDVGLLT